MKNDRLKLPFRNTCEGYFVDGKGNVLARKSEYEILIFPGGGIDDGENVEDGMLREAFEEAGAKIKKLKFLGNMKIIWGEKWAKTKKQKERYEQYQGEEMHFFSGEIESMGENTGEEDSWKEDKFMPLGEAIKFIEENNSEESTKEYRQRQVEFLKDILK